MTLQITYICKRCRETKVQELRTRRGGRRQYCPACNVLDQRDRGRDYWKYKYRFRKNKSFIGVAP